MAFKLEHLHSLEDTGGDGKVIWCVGVNPVSGSHDQLVGGAREVVWYQQLDPRIQTVHKTYTTDHDILQAFWTKFPVSERKQGGVVRAERGNVGGAGSQNGGVKKTEDVCVCLREQGSADSKHGCLALFMETGALHYVPLPFPVRRVWPLADGVLVERLADGDHYDGLPMLFSLLHPLDELCPVTCRAPTPTPGVTTLGFFGELGLQVLDICEEATPPFVLTYNTSSQLHSIWSIQRATKEDLPSHSTAPQSNTTLLATPAKPLSSTDPCCYNNEATPCGMMHTPVEMVLLRGTDKSKSVLSQFQQQQHSAVPSSDGRGPRVPGSGRGLWVPGSGRGLQAPGSGQGSGRSPFNRQTSNSDAFLMKCSKSLSPACMARMSPFSQTVDSKSWCTFYSEEFSVAYDQDPLFPQLCLHLRWSTKLPEHHPATSMFCTRDLIGCDYVGVVHNASNRLWMIQCNGDTLQSVTMDTVPGCLAALPLSVRVMIVLDVEGLILYSGVTKMRRLCVGIPVGPSAPVSISQPLQDTFTLSFPSGAGVRCHLPPPSHHSIVEVCLGCLKELLPPQVAMETVCGYTCSVWGGASSQSLPHFVRWLRAALQLAPCFAGGVVGDVSDIVSLEDHREMVALGLHMAYEEVKLYPEKQGLQELAELLLLLARCLGWRLYVDHYQRDFPALFLQPPSQPSSSSAPPTMSSEHEPMEEATPPAIPLTPPHIHQWLLLKLQNSQPPPFPVLPHVCTRTFQLIKLYSLMTSPMGECLDVLTLMTPLAGALSPEQTSWTRLQGPPEHRVVLQLVQEGLTTMLDLNLFPVGVALPLLHCIRSCREAPPTSWPPAAYDLIGRVDISMTQSATVTLDTPILEVRGDSDGMNLDLEVLKLRFPQDLRAKEVRRLLQSAEPVRIAIQQRPEVSDHEFIEEQETYLLAVSQRTMALPVGRGMFTLSTVHPLPTSPVSIPTLNLCGRVPPRNSNLGLDHVDKPADMTQWPHFHNGVAAGLRLALGSSKLDAAWILFNRPSEQDTSNTYAGFLMGLGLTGHLTSLQDYDIYGYLQHKHELTVVGLLLGVSASNYGRATPSLVSLLSIYFRPLLPSGSADMEISQPMQTAALLGVGLLYMGSANRHMAKVVLGEIGHAPGPELEFAENRESYGLTAGLALGMITLGLGGEELSSLADLHLVDKLLHFMKGGLKREGVSGGVASSAMPCHLVMEGELTNTHVTAPGAIMALGLMYLKTNDIPIAAMLDAPKSHYELDCVRPDFLMLRALCHGLVMWDAVTPSQQWIDQHMPQVVLQTVAQVEERQERLVDLQTLHQAHAYITAGCCFAMGLKYAGTCDPKPYQCLLKVIQTFLSVPKGEEENVGKHCIEQCLLSVLLALAMIEFSVDLGPLPYLHTKFGLVMSGSGDIPILRIIRQLHVRTRRGEVTYGSHMATHMALGLLFLGGGRYTLSHSNVGVAALLCALYPCFPDSSVDNRYHLQALRHLYVLATSPGMLMARDMATSEPSCVEVRLTVEGGVSRDCVTPCLVQDWDMLQEVKLISDKHWPMTLQLDDQLRTILSQRGVIYVQERASANQEVKVDCVCDGEENLMGVKGVLMVPYVKGPLYPLITKQRYPSTQFMAAVFLECLRQDKQLVFSTYLYLEQSIQRLNDPDHTPNSLLTGTTPPNPMHVLWQLKLVSAYVNGCSTSCWSGRGRGPLLSQQFVTALVGKVWSQVWSDKDTILNTLKKYLSHSEGVWSHSLEQVLLLAKLLVWADIPHHFIVLS